MEVHRILVAWHQLYLVPFDANAQFVGDGVGTLVAAAADPEHLIVRTGCATGPVRVSLTSHPAPPVRASEDVSHPARPWEAVEELSMPITQPLFWSSPEPGWDLPRDAAFTPQTPGPHRVRVSARGRTIAYDEAIVDPVEDYVVQVWPVAELHSAEVLSSDEAPVRVETVPQMILGRTAAGP